MSSKNPKNRLLQLRVGPETDTLIENAAKHAGLSRSDWLRRAALRQAAEEAGSDGETSSSPDRASAGPASSGLLRDLTGGARRGFLLTMTAGMYDAVAEAAKDAGDRSMSQWIRDAITARIPGAPVLGRGAGAGRVRWRHGGDVREGGVEAGTPASGRARSD